MRLSSTRKIVEISLRACMQHPLHHAFKNHHEPLVLARRTLLTNAEQQQELNDSWIPKPAPREGESLNDKRSRLQYQSRKRGMLENGLLLSNFAASCLNQLNENELADFDKLINEPSNDWSIFYWAIGKEQVPEEFDTPIFRRLKEFASNSTQNQRSFQPELQSVRH